MGLLLTAHLAEQRCSILPSGQLGGCHSFCLIIRYQEPSSDLHWEILTENNLILISCLGHRKSASPLGRTNLSKSGPNEPGNISCHALFILPWSHFPRPLTNRSRQSRFKHWQWSRGNLACGARILKILLPKTMYCVWETCPPHE